MREIDLDAARAARAEKNNEPYVFIFGGEKFEVPSTNLTIEFAHLVDLGDYKEALQELLQDKFEAFYANRPTHEDMDDLCALIIKARSAGEDAGKSKASDVS